MSAGESWGQGFEQTEWTGGLAVPIPKGSTREGMQGVIPGEETEMPSRSVILAALEREMALAEEKLRASGFNDDIEVEFLEINGQRIFEREEWHSA